MRYTLTATHVTYEDGTTTYRNQWLSPEVQTAFHSAGCPVTGEGRRQSEALEQLCCDKDLSDPKVLLVIIYNELHRILAL